MLHSILSAWLCPLVLSTATSGPAETGGAMPETNPAQEAALLQAAGPGFSIKRTRHFLIAYDTDPALVNLLTNRLEQTHHMVYRFCELNNLAVARRDERLEVVLFDERASYDQHAARLQFPSAGTYGAYFESTNRSAFLNTAHDEQLLQLQAEIAAARENLDRLAGTLDRIQGEQTHVELRFADGRRLAGTKVQVRKEIGDEIARSHDELDTLERRQEAYIDYINRAVVQHETAHQVLFNAGVHVRGARNPRWLVEGLACLFETPPGPTGTAFAAVNPLRLRDFRSAIAGESQKQRLTWEDYEQALAAGRLPPPRKLIMEPPLFDQRGEAGAACYAATWALSHFLQRTRGEQLGGYLKAASSRKPGGDPSPAEELALFEAHCGPLDARFARELGSYILGLKSPSSPRGL